jgi:hypothetical protein
MKPPFPFIPPWNGPIVGRRDALSQLGCGFGALALAGLTPPAHSTDPIASHPFAPKAASEAPRAKRIIFLFMQGGVSHVDSFDYKPRLKSDNGRLLDFDDLRSIAKTGSSPKQRVMAPLWEFQQRGKSGMWISELFPEMARHADDLCVIRSMQTEGIAHGPATLFLHTGSTNFVRPSMGAWICYGLGTENQNLPAFVSICPSLGNGGPRNYGTAFLPAIFQGTAVGRAGQPAKETVIRNLAPSPLFNADSHQLAAIRSLNTVQSQTAPPGSEIEAAVQGYELAARMQLSAPLAFDLESEPQSVRDLYGIGSKPTDTFGRQCLLARKLAEQGVRFIQVNYGDNSNNPSWDQHSNLPKHGEHALAVDRPVAGLLSDLKQRGLLEDTIVWWGGEFGRTPYAEKNGTGRDHNPAGFSIWLAGGGFKPGHSHGETDEFGHHAVVDKIHMHDLHATLLHALGLNHEKLTYRHAGRDYRLTDVHGRVAHELFV